MYIYSVHAYCSTLHVHAGKRRGIQRESGREGEVINEGTYMHNAHTVHARERKGVIHVYTKVIHADTITTLLL